MASVAAIRSGLETRLETIASVIAHDKVPGDINFPQSGAAIVVFPGDPLIEFDATMGRGSDDFNFVVQVFVSNSQIELAQSKLDGFLAGSGASSVRAAIDGDDTLGGVAHFCKVVRAQNYGTATFAGTECLSVQFVVEVTASGS